jgi:RNA polymerase sigma-70 factor (ECF subfamily)
MDLIFHAVEDADLIRQAAEGTVAAYNLLVSRWEKRVYNYLLRITGHREDALDLTQDVFLKAYQNLRKLDDPARFAPWLYRIAHNEAYSMFRRRKPETAEDKIEPVSTETGITVGGSSLFPVELSLDIASAMERLSADQREAVVLKIYRGFKFDEMAEILACPVSTVKSRLYTALESLKADLAPGPPQARRTLLVSRSEGADARTGASESRIFRRYSWRKAPMGLNLAARRELSAAAKKGASLAVEREPGMRLRSGRRWAQEWRGSDYFFSEAELSSLLTRGVR